MRFTFQLWQARSAKLPLLGSRSGLRLFVLLLPIALATAGCGVGTPVAAHTGLNVTPGIATVDTNCAGCNALTPSGAATEQFSAHLEDGTPAAVLWAVSAAPVSGSGSTRALAAPAGSITSEGRYTPPVYLTQDALAVTVTATLVSDPAVSASTTLTVTPGFFQPLTPENVAIGPNGSATITGMLAEAGGSTAIHFALASSPLGSLSGSPGSDLGTGLGTGLGTLSRSHCQRHPLAATTCSVVYTAPAMLSASSLAYVVATVDHSSSRVIATVLINASGITSNPVPHQVQQFSPVLLGSSGGHHFDYETDHNTITGCCGGTLGALVEDRSGTQFLLSNNHVLALGDQALSGDPIVQPALIDNGCSPSGVTAIGALASFVPLAARHSNVDAALARIATGSVDSAGRILEFGTKLADGTLGSAPPGISSTGGRGEAIVASMLPLAVAKSGRTTGLTCANVSAVGLDVKVEYFKDCAETIPSFSKTFTNQIGMSGNGFSDAGDSGALVVDAANAEPVGLLFAGGLDSAGVSQAIANPVADVLGELSSQSASGALQSTASGYSFVGTADHPVSCLSYGDSTVATLQSRSLSRAEIDRAQPALSAARGLVNSSSGIVGVALGKSNDSPGEAAIILYIDEAGSGATLSVPTQIDGVRTQILATTSRALAAGSAPASVAASSALNLSSSALNAALAVKRQLSAWLFSSQPAFFGVGVGQSLDNPREAALVIYVDRHHAPAELQPTYNGLRARYLLMERLHVTRSYAEPIGTRRACGAIRSTSQASTGHQFDHILDKLPFKFD